MPVLLVLMFILMVPVLILMNVRPHQDPVDLERCVKIRLDLSAVFVQEELLEIHTLDCVQLTRHNALEIGTVDQMRSVLNQGSVSVHLHTFLTLQMVESVRVPVKDFSVV